MIFRSHVHLIKFIANFIARKNGLPLILATVKPFVTVYIALMYPSSIEIDYMAERFLIVSCHVQNTHTYRKCINGQ